MSYSCDVSVVMSVYNNEDTVGEAIKSILDQDGVKLELIIIIDGGNDASDSIASEYARRDSRIKLIVQENAGLTRALIRGCSAACGRFIARQDADDVSYPNRLKKQMQLLDSDKVAVLAGCGTRFTTMDGHELYRSFPDADQAMMQVNALELLGLKIVAGHGSAMFRADAYQKVGRYREEFYFAQDVDLWIRLLETGSYRVVNEVLYQQRLSAQGISSVQRAEQVALAHLAMQSARARRNGASDQPLMAAASCIRPRPTKPLNRLRSRIRLAKGLYFFGACLSDRRNPIARSYYLNSIHTWPFQLRPWLRLLRTSFLR